MDNAHTAGSGRDGRRIPLEEDSTRRRFDEKKIRVGSAPSRPGEAAGQSGGRRTENNRADPLGDPHVVCNQRDGMQVDQTELFISLVLCMSHVWPGPDGQLSASRRCGNGSLHPGSKHEPENRPLEGIEGFAVTPTQCMTVDAV